MVVVWSLLFVSSWLVVLTLIRCRSLAVSALVHTILQMRLLLFLHLIDHLVRYSQVLDHRAANVALVHSPEPVAVSRRADHLAQIDVHPVVTAHQVTVVRLAVLQFDQLVEEED